MLKMYLIRDESGCIGNGPEMPWIIGNEMIFFNQVTKGASFLVGRKTWEKLPDRLKDKEVYVLTRNEKYKADGAFVIHSRDQVEKVAAKKDLFIIGGESMFSFWFYFCDEAYEVKVEASCDGSSYFNNSFSGWETEHLGRMTKSKTNQYAFDVWKHKNLVK